MHSSGPPEAFNDRCVVGGGGDEQQSDVDRPALVAQSVIINSSLGGVPERVARCESKTKEVLFPQNGSGGESVSSEGGAQGTSEVLGATLPNDTDTFAKFVPSPAEAKDMPAAQGSPRGGLDDKGCPEQVSVTALCGPHGASCVTQASAADDERTISMEEPPGGPAELTSPTSPLVFSAPCPSWEREGAGSAVSLSPGASAPGRGRVLTLAGDEELKSCGVATDVDPRPSSNTALVADAVVVSGSVACTSPTTCECPLPGARGRWEK